MICIAALVVNALLEPANALSTAAYAEQPLQLDGSGDTEAATMEERVLHVGPDSDSVLSVRVLMLQVSHTKCVGKSCTHTCSSMQSNDIYIPRMVISCF